MTNQMPELTPDLAAALGELWTLRLTRFEDELEDALRSLVAGAPDDPVAAVREAIEAEQ